MSVKRVQYLRGTPAALAALTPPLLPGEVAQDTTTNRIRVGDCSGTVARGLSVPLLTDTALVLTDLNALLDLPVEDLRANQAALLLGQGDPAGTAGLLTWDPTATDTVDNVRVFAPTASATGAGRFLRTAGIFNGNFLVSAGVDDPNGTRAGTLNLTLGEVELYFRYSLVSHTITGVYLFAGTPGTDTDWITFG